MSRNKGNAFERRIAKDIVQAYAPLGITKKDCYRTPLSGGHPHGDRGDLVISMNLAPYFPFVVECKHYRDWNPGVLVADRLRAQERGWFHQAVTATGKTVSHFLQPITLVVMSGNATGVFAAGPHLELTKFFPDLKTCRPNVRFLYKKEMWTMWTWESMTHLMNKYALFEAQKRDALKKR